MLCHSADGSHTLHYTLELVAHAARRTRITVNDCGGVALDDGCIELQLVVLLVRTGSGEIWVVVGVTVVAVLVQLGANLLVCVALVDARVLVGFLVVYTGAGSAAFLAIITAVARAATLAGAVSAAFLSSSVGTRSLSRSSSVQVLFIFDKHKARFLGTSLKYESSFLFSIAFFSKSSFS